MTQSPVAASKDDVARGGEVAGPLVVQDAGAEALGDLDGAVGRAGVDDDDLVDGVARGGEAARRASPPRP